MIYISIIYINVYIYIYNKETKQINSIPNLT